MCTRWSSPRSSSVAITGSLPSNSGIIPNASRSHGRTWRRRSPSSSCRSSSVGAPKPNLPASRPRRRAMMSSRPGKAPPQMKSTSVVSKGTVSASGCLGPSFAGMNDDPGLEHLEEGVLDPFAGGVLGHPRVAVVLPQLVDLVDEDDAPGGPAGLAARGEVQPGQQALHVVADVSGLREGRGVSDDDRDVRASWRAPGPGASCRSRSGRSAGRWTARWARASGRGRRRGGRGRSPSRSIARRRPVA